MAVIKCKMCGGDLDISEGLSVCECEYCGTKQTVPAADNEKKLTLFARANRLRLANEFDKAAGVYESIVADFPEEAEAYWGLVLCRYGIEYVDDPATGKKVPTCHRVSFDSVLEDTDFDQACENADALARRQYREEAKQIEEIRRGIIEVSGKEEPYDIFICYKETDENGERTVDSVIAQDVYDALTEKGYRVFFSRISLEDKLGTEYEPYIFAALNSAKLMLAFGTDYEYYNAVWVKNEWSRFLKLMEKDKTKHLIPCYKGIDAYDMPKEFHRLQGQDMGKVGAVQDLLRGIEKILPRKEAVPQPNVQQVVQSGGPNTAALLQRGNMALEDGDWEKAKDYFDQVLNMDAQCAEAYLGLMLAGQELKCVEDIAALHDSRKLQTIQESAAFKRFVHFASAEQRLTIELPLEKAQNAVSRFVEELQRIRNRFKTVQTMVACSSDACTSVTIGLRSDGTTVAVGQNENGQCDVGAWRDIVAVSAGGAHTVGLRSDGTVVAVGFNVDGQCDVGAWRDIVAVSAGPMCTVGLRSNGTVVAVGHNEDGQCDVGTWRDIVAVSAGGAHTVGLRSNGTVVAVGYNKFGQCDVGAWRDIVAVSAGNIHTVGLRSDGMVVAVGDNEDGECDVGAWRDIVAVSAGCSHTVGLRSDGTVVTAGKIWLGRGDIGVWRNIVAVSAGSFHTVGLRSDGMVVAVGDNEYDECETGTWKLFGSMDTIEQERRQAHERYEYERNEAARECQEEAERIKAERERKQRELTDEQTRLKTELANIKGLFSGKRRKEIEARLAEIDAELKKLQ